MQRPVDPAPLTQVTPASPIAAAPSPAGSPSGSPAPSKAAHSAIPLPSLKPGEVITWVKLDRPRFAIGEIIVNSFTIVGLIILMAVGAGMLLGHLRSKRGGTHGTGGLGLR